MTPQQINEAVARKLGATDIHVLKWPKMVFNNRPHPWHGMLVGTFPSVGASGESPVPDYCHSIEAAWEIVEANHEKYAFEIHSSPNDYHAFFTGPTWKQTYKGQADTAPMAICKAFLKLP